MSTAVIGVGNIGGTVARHLVAGGEPVVVASQDESRSSALAGSLGSLGRAATVGDALASADTVVLALWLPAMREVIASNGTGLEGKVVIDPSNPVGYDASGVPMRTLPEGQSAGSLVASLIPASAHYAKAFGTLGAGDLATSANRQPRRAVLFYATDDAVAQTAVERLIVAAGFDPLKVGGVADAWRIEVPGGDLQGGLFDADEAAAKVASGGLS
ncbi:MAG TPA: NAD(P)-binding domain-containing protein [Acidimicrobiales bacterium]|nr:NAD(P)-binding domain-containing protein [Acidimicrobiales bacterium]